MSNNRILRSSFKFHKSQAELAKVIFTERVKVCMPDSQAHMTPFFTPDLNLDNNMSDRLLNPHATSEYISKLNTFWEKVGLSRLLYYIYLTLGADNIEFNLDNYIFFSLSDLEERYNTYVDAGQTRICDLAHTYMGMGHVKVLSFDIASKMIYYRHDGGSNGWDRESHWNFAKTLDLSKYNDKLYSLDEFLKVPTVDNIDNYDNMVN